MGRLGEREIANKKLRCKKPIKIWDANIENISILKSQNLKNLKIS